MGDAHPLAVPDGARARTAARRDQEQVVAWPAPIDDETAWALARALSPRQRVRLADASGRNDYAVEAAVTRRTPPGQAWAVYLTRGRPHRFRLLAFDLDTSWGPVGEDCAQLLAWLDQAGVPAVVCESGPSGGRHVWVGLGGDGAAADSVLTLARALSRLLPTLDTAPLLNPRTGCVRPPGAPHRLGGRSTVLAGDVATLISPRLDGDDVVSRLQAVLGPVTDPAARDDGVPIRDRAVAVDEDGHPHLAGRRRDLSPTARQDLVTAVGAGEDASARLWRILLAAARARWQLRDIAAVMATAPALEHLRTRRDRHDGTRRVPRAGEDSHAVLARQWSRAVQHLSQRPDSSAEDTGDPTWETRTAEVTELVAAVQAAADADPLPWAVRGGRYRRRVLDVVCEMHLAAVATAATGVELDVRRLALAAGCGRETARQALHTLARAGWLRLLAPAVGRAAAHWALTPRATARPADPTTGPTSKTAGQANDNSEIKREWTQADTRPLPATPPGPPPPSGTARRAAWLQRLQHRAAALTHDVWAERTGLGGTAGVMWLALHQPGSAQDAAAAAGISTVHGQIVLGRLAEHGLVHRTPGGWAATTQLPTGDDPRVRAAMATGTHGRLAARARAYAAERIVWQWWTDEVTWLRTPRAERPRTRHRRRPGLDQTALPLPHTTWRSRLGRYPRRPDGTPDHPAARLHVLDQLSTTPRAILAAA